MLLQDNHKDEFIALVNPHSKLGITVHIWREEPIDAKCRLLGSNVLASGLTCWRFNAHVVHNKKASDNHFKQEFELSLNKHMSEGTSTVRDSPSSSKP